MKLKYIIDKLDSKLERFLIKEEYRAYLYDTYFKIVRNRVNAEYCKGLIRLGRKKEIVQKIINYLIETQNKDGSWNEIHLYYNEPSSLVTSIVGDAMIEWYKSTGDEGLIDTIESAKNYVLSNKKGSGYFIKSKNYHQDHLNVDATCADFLSSYAGCFSNDDSKQIAKTSLDHIRNHQFNDGVFPYRVKTGGMNNSMNVPCIHYQGVTIYYLKKTFKNLELENADWLVKATDWLANSQKKDGSFDWSKSSLMFAYRLTGAYAFALASYSLIKKEEYSQKTKQCSEILDDHIDDLVLRWEIKKNSELLPSLVSVLVSSNRGNNNIIDFLYKTGYGYYREFSRRRYTEDPDKDILFEKLNDMFSLSSSTIEPSKNYPDLFMTTECFDCLTYVMS